MNYASIVIMLVSGGLVLAPFFVFAETSTTEEVKTISEAIKEKRGSLDEVNDRIKTLEKEVFRLEKQARSLETEIAIIENRTEKVELDIEATNLQLSALFDEVTVLDGKLVDLEEELTRQRTALKSALQELNVTDQRNRLFLVFGTGSFSQFFERARFFERVNQRVRRAIERTNELQKNIEAERKEKEVRLASVQELSDKLETQKIQLEYQEHAKEVLAGQTRESQSEYETLVDELLAEQAAIQNQIVALQSDIDERLREGDAVEGGLSALSWPLDAKNNRITTLFHDPDYPFRHLFEHSGLDIAAPVGSAVRAPAPGYVAWTRQGRLYGNYMMVIHADGVATLYAHLSSFEAAADQFVSRGDVIARTGGCRGCAGAGLSTGPHLHFEVRRNGIPTNPLSLVIRP